MGATVSQFTTRNVPLCIKRDLFNILLRIKKNIVIFMANSTFQKVSQNSAMERLTDSSKYGGTHKQRFTPDGKGKGKEGRVDAKPAAFRENKGNSRA